MSNRLLNHQQKPFPTTTPKPPTDAPEPTEEVAAQSDDDWGGIIISTSENGPEFVERVRVAAATRGTSEDFFELGFDEMGEHT